MTYHAVVCLHHRCIKCQNVPSFLTKLAVKSYKLEQPILRGCRSASRGAARLVRHTEAPDQPQTSICWPPRGLLQYRTPLQHCVNDQETDDRTKRRRNSSRRGFACGSFCKQWQPPNASGGSHDEGTRKSWSHNKVYTKETEVALCAKIESEMQSHKPTVGIKRYWYTQTN